MENFDSISDALKMVSICLCANLLIQSPDTTMS